MSVHPAPGLRRRELAAWAMAAAGGVAWARRSHAQPASDAGSSLHRLHTGDLGALVAVDATLGGRPFRALLDTGASVALVSPAVAARQGLREVDRRRVATAGGTMTLVRVALPPLEIAGRSAPATHALVLDLEAALGDAGAAVDGLVGMSALRGHAVRLDLASGRLRWVDEPGTRPSAAWPLAWDDGLPVVELALANREPAPFLLDTGNAGALVVFAHHAARLTAGRAALPTVTLRELGGEVAIHALRLSRLAAPGYLARDVPAAFEAGDRGRRGGPFNRLAGSAGLALFAGGALTLDGPGARVLVEHPALPDVPPLPGGFGLALQTVAGEAPRVAAVYDGGPAARAGVRPGQRLRTLDGAELAGVRAGEVWRRLVGVESATFGFDALPAITVLRRERFFARWP